MSPFAYWAAALALCFAIGSSYRLDAGKDTEQLTAQDLNDAIAMARVAAKETKWTK